MAGAFKRPAVDPSGNPTGPWVWDVAGDGSQGYIPAEAVYTGGSGGGPATIADGADAAEGTTTDTPFVGAEDGTSRTGVSLWKGIKNVLGITTGTAVTTNAAGTIQQYMRGLIALLAAGLSTLQKWSALSTATVLFDNAGSAPTLKSLANGALALSAAYDNTALLNTVVNLLLNVKGAVAFTANSTIDVWFLTSLDGATYEDGAGTAPGPAVTPGRPPDAFFFLQGVNTAQVLTLTNLQIPPTKFKVLVRNSGGQALTNVNADNTMSLYVNS